MTDGAQITHMQTAIVCLRWSYRVWWRDTRSTIGAVQVDHFSYPTRTHSRWCYPYPYPTHAENFYPYPTRKYPYP